MGTRAAQARRSERSTASSATSVGIVIASAATPLRTHCAKAGRRSEPGARSTISASRRPHSVQASRSASADCSIALRSAAASPCSPSQSSGWLPWRKKSMLWTRRPRGPGTGRRVSSAASRKGWPRRPSILATEGPCRSASSRPIARPRCASASARFTATALLPTPPFPLITAITRATDARRSLTRRRAEAISSSSRGSRTRGSVVPGAADVTRRPSGWGRSFRPGRGAGAPAGAAAPA